MSAERIARAFHEAYERLAPAAGYETRAESAGAWEDVPTANRALMIATVEALLEDRTIIDGKPRISVDAVVRVLSDADGRVRRVLSVSDGAELPVFGVSTEQTVEDRGGIVTLTFHRFHVAWEFLPSPNERQREDLAQRLDDARSRGEHLPAAGDCWCVGRDHPEPREDRPEDR